MAILASTLYEKNLFYQQVSFKAKLFTEMKNKLLYERAASLVTKALFITAYSSVYLADFLCGWFAFAVVQGNPAIRQMIARIVSQYTINSLQWTNELIQWIMGIPGGLKLNTPLNNFLGTRFLGILELWQYFYSDFIALYMDSIVAVLILLLPFGLTLFLTALHDFLKFLHLCLICFFVFTSRTIGLKVSTLKSLARLFMGKKWNMLKKRVDSCDYDTNQLLVGTILFTILLFLLPTTGVYFALFLLLRLMQFTVQLVLRVFAVSINSVSVSCWSFLCSIVKDQPLTGLKVIVALDKDGSTDGHRTTICFGLNSKVYTSSEIRTIIESTPVDSVLQQIRENKTFGFSSVNLHSSEKETFEHPMLYWLGSSIPNSEMMATGNSLYYVTYKYVLLKDARLGVLYYVLALLILTFTMVEICVKKGYLEFDIRPQGTFKLILSDDFAGSNVAVNDLPYCLGDVPCVYLDPWDLNWPLESRSVTITSYGKDRIQFKNNGSAGEYKIKEEKVYFALGPEHVVIKVDHSVVATRFTDSQGRETLAASHRQLRGFLMDSSGEVMREVSAPGLGRPDRARARSQRLSSEFEVTVGELLKAAGVESLDNVSDIINAKGRTFRERGLILRVTVFYQNWYSTWIGTSDVEYRYHVRRVPFVDYNSKQVEPLLSKEEILHNVGTHLAQKRLVKKRYSIRIEFEQAGSLGQFSLPTFLFKLVSGMGLLTLTATVIDTLALYILPDRSKYRRWVYEESTDLKERRTNKTD